MNDERAIYRGRPSYVWQAGQERRLGMVRQAVPLQDCRILDVGCGLGMYTDAFLRYSNEVYGIEIEHDRAMEAIPRARGIAQAIGESLPFPDCTFDVVFSHEVLEHVSDDRRAMVEMARVTRRGGYVVIFAPNRLWPWETHGFYWRGQYHQGNIPLINYLPNRWRNQLAGHVRIYTKKNLLDLCAGLPLRVAVWCTVYPGFDKVARRMPAISPAIRAISYRLETWPGFNRLGLSHFLVMEKAE